MFWWPPKKNLLTFCFRNNWRRVWSRLRFISALFSACLLALSAAACTPWHSSTHSLPEVGDSTSRRWEDKGGLSWHACCLLCKPEAQYQPKDSCFIELRSEQRNYESLRVTRLQMWNTRGPFQAGWASGTVYQLLFIAFIWPDMSGSESQTPNAWLLYFNFPSPRLVLVSFQFPTGSIPVHSADGGGHGLLMRRPITQKTF